MMIRESLEHDLPEPDFVMRGGEFTLTLWRDWLTPEVLAGYNLNERQVKAVLLVKTGEQLSNKEYQQQFGVSKPTASRDLDDLLQKGIVEKIGTTGKGTYYILGRKGLTKGSKGS